MFFIIKGLIKIRGDQCWRDLTCMNYHYEVINFDDLPLIGRVDVILKKIFFQSLTDSASAKSYELFYAPVSRDIPQE